MADQKKVHFSKSAIGYIPSSTAGWLHLIGTISFALLSLFVLKFGASSIGFEDTEFLNFLVLAIAALYVWQFAKRHS